MHAGWQINFPWGGWLAGLIERRVSQLSPAKLELELGLILAIQILNPNLSGPFFLLKELQFYKECFPNFWRKPQCCRRWTGNDEIWPRLRDQCFSWNSCSNQKLFTVPKNLWGTPFWISVPFLEPSRCLFFGETGGERVISSPLGW